MVHTLIALLASASRQRLRQPSSSSLPQCTIKCRTFMKLCSLFVFPIPSPKLGYKVLIRDKTSSKYSCIAVSNIALFMFAILTRQKEYNVRTGTICSLGAQAHRSNSKRSLLSSAGRRLHVFIIQPQKMVRKRWKRGVPDSSHGCHNNYYAHHGACAPIYSWPILC